MAERIAKPEQTESAAADAARELAIIASPEKTDTIAGREITMREPTWLEAIELDPELAPVVEAIEALVREGGDFDGGALQRLLYRHRDVLVTMMGVCAGVDPDWIAKLPDADGQRLSALFWTVNGPFFGRRVSMRRAALLAAVGRVGPTSSKH